MPKIDANDLQVHGYPEEFYHGVKTMDNQYQNAPTDNLCVEHLLQGEPCWLSHNPTVTLAKKTLIMADWATVALENHELDTIKAWLIKAIKDGFTIYMWQDRNLAPLTEQAVKQLDHWQLQKITPVPNEDLVDAANKTIELSPEHIKILDYHQVNNVIFNKGLQRHSIYLSPM